MTPLTLLCRADDVDDERYVKARTPEGRAGQLVPGDARVEVPQLADERALPLDRGAEGDGVPFPCWIWAMAPQPTTAQT